MEHKHNQGRHAIAYVELTSATNGAQVCECGTAHPFTVKDGDPILKIMYVGERVDAVEFGRRAQLELRGEFKLSDIPEPYRFAPEASVWGGLWQDEHLIRLVDTLMPADKDMFHVR